MASGYVANGKSANNNFRARQGSPSKRQVYSTIDVTGGSDLWHGRQNYLTLQALIYSIGCIQALPEERQEYSNMLDMCDMVLALSDDTIAVYLSRVESHLGRELNLWPDDCCDEDLERASRIRQLIAMRRKIVRPTNR